MNTYLAVDFGGGSGRVMAGSICQGTLKLEEVYRFPNRQVRMGNHVYWDFLALFDEMKNGLRQAVRKGYHIRSIGIDTWGVDFGLIDRNGNLLGNPVCYRDPRTDGLLEEFFGDNLVRHYSEAGIQVMSINTLFQLYSMKKSGDTQLEVADRLLFMRFLRHRWINPVVPSSVPVRGLCWVLNWMNLSSRKKLAAPASPMRAG